MRRAPSVDHSTVAAPGAVVEAAPDDETTTALPEVAFEHAPVGGGERRASRARGRGALLGAIAVAFVLVMLVSAVAPAPAQAIKIPNPVDIVTGPVTGGIADMAVNAFDAIIKHLFAPITKLVTVELIGWLVAIPNFTAGTHVAQLQTTVTAMAGGLLAAVATLSIARYWLIGHAGDGFAALEGLARTVAAAFALAMWPWAFGQAVHLTNLFTSSLLASDSVVKPCATMLATAIGVGWAAGPLGLFLGLVIAIATLLLFLALLVLKIAVSVSTILVFVGMPLAIVLWPVAPWVLGIVGRAFAACLAVPVLWALCFAAAAAVSLDSVTLSGGGAAVDKVIQPLVAIVLLYLMVKLPITLARIAMIGSQAISGGFVSRAVSYAAGRAVSNTVSQQIPEAMGRQQAGHAEAPLRRGMAPIEGAKSARASTAAKTAAAGAAAAATGGAGVAATGAGTGAGASAGAAAGSATRPARAQTVPGAAAERASGYQPPPTAQSASRRRSPGRSARASVSVLSQRRTSTPRCTRPNTASSTSPVSAQQARERAADLPEAARRGLAAGRAKRHRPGGRRAPGARLPRHGRRLDPRTARRDPHPRRRRTRDSRPSPQPWSTRTQAPSPPVPSATSPAATPVSSTSARPSTNGQSTEGHDQPQAPAPPPSPAIHTSAADGETRRRQRGRRAPAHRSTLGRS